MTQIIHNATIPNIPVDQLYDGKITDFIRSGGHSNETKPSVIDAKTGQTLSQAEMWQLSDKYAALLSSQYGLCRHRDNELDPSMGDVLITFFGNVILAPVVHWAALDLGATISPGSTGYSVQDLAHQFRVTTPKVVVYAKAFKDVVDEATKLYNSPNPPALVELEALDKQARMVGNHKVEHTRKIKLAPHESRTRIAYLGMSSGTSGGVSKAVRLTHSNLTSCSEISNKASESLATDQQIAAAIIPVSHLFGLSKFLIGNPHAGATTVYHNGFDLIEVLEAQKKYKVNSWTLVPPIIVLLTKHPIVEKYIPSLRAHMRAILSGAAPLGANVTEALLTRVTGNKFGESPEGGLRIVQGYGLTETSPVATLFDPEDKERHIRSCGKLVPNSQVRIVNEDGVDQPAYDVDPNELDEAIKQGTLPVGELWIRGPQVMDGYHNNPEANEACFVKADDAEADTAYYNRHWFRTGDVALVDKQGRYMIVDRTKEMIKSQGKQVAPAELEDMLLGHAQVADTAVIGIQDVEKGNEAPRAFVVLKDPKYDAVEIKTWLDKQLPKYKQLHAGIVVIDAIPKNASGKILRRLLRARKDDVVLGLNKAKL